MPYTVVDETTGNEFEFDDAFPPDKARDVIISKRPRNDSFSLGEYTNVEATPEESEQLGRGTLETAGMVGGGVAGAFLGPAGVIGGETAGFTGGRKVGDLLYGSRPDSSLAKDIGTGAAYSLVPRLLGTAVKGAVRAIPTEWAKKLYHSSIKFPVNSKEWKVNKALDSAFENRIVVSRSGQAELQGKLDDVRKEVANIISPGRNQLISVDDILAKVSKLEDKYRDKVIIKDHLDTLREMVGQFKLERKNLMTLEQAQKIKIDAWIKSDPYWRARGQVGGKRETSTETDFYVELGEALKNEVEQRLPNIHKVNERFGGMIELQLAVDKAIGRVSNKELVSLLDVIAVDATRTGESWGTGLKVMLARKLLEWPRFKSWLAIEITRAAKKPLVSARPGVAAVTPALKNLLQE